MAVSGSQKTRIGASISAIGIKLTITAKAEGIIPTVFCLLRAVREGDLTATREGNLTAELVDDDFLRPCS